MHRLCHKLFPGVDENKKKLLKIIEADGWYVVGRVAAIVSINILERGLVMIPIHHLSNDFTPGLEKSILKQAQLNKK